MKGPGETGETCLLTINTDLYEAQQKTVAFFSRFALRDELKFFAAD